MGGGGAPSGGVYVMFGKIGDLKAHFKPNTRVDLYNSDNEKIQSRWYDSSGKAMRNRDYKHGGINIPFPHDHKWNWEKDNPREKDHLEPNNEDFE